MRGSNWTNYIDEKGHFELPSYLYKTILDLMKTTLDFGTMLSDDPAKLRAYKESVKSIFKNRWLEVAQALESFDIIVPCGCPNNEYCKACGGARYKLNAALSPDELREISTVVTNDDEKLAQQLEEGLRKALIEIEKART